MSPGLWFRVSHIAAIKGLDPAASHLKAQLGEGPICKPTWVLAEFSFLEVVGAMASVSCWLLAGGLPNKATCIIEASQGERVC